MTARSWMVAALMALLVFTGARGAAADDERGWQSLQSELHLTSAQIARLKPILKQHQEARRNRVASIRSRINEILTADQVARFKQILADCRREEETSGGKPADGPHQANREQFFRGVLEKVGATQAQMQQIEACVHGLRAQAEADREKFKTQLRSVLSSDQADRLEQLMRKHAHHGHMGDVEGSGAPPPH